MSKVVLVLRVLMGLPLVVLGANGFLEWFEVPTGTQPADAIRFLHALEQGVYLMPLVRGVEILAGVLLLMGWLVPLALLLMAPLLVNYVAFHVFLDSPANGVLAYSLAGLELLLAICYGPSFRSVLAFRPPHRFR